MPMIDFAGRRYPFTGFGDEPNAAIKFMMIRRGSDPEYGWQGGEARVNTFGIRHSNDTVSQGDGFDPYMMTVRLWFPDRASLIAMTAVQGGQATLRYNAELTEAIGGEIVTIAGRRYLELPDVELVSLTDRITPRQTPPEAVATFRRSVGTSYAVAGFAVAKETGA